MTLDLAWLTGVIEGEGTFGVAVNKKFRAGEQREYPYAQVRVRMTDEDVVRRCHEVGQTFGGGGVYGPFSDKRNPHYKPYWEWRITGRPAKALLAAVLPLLGQRRAARALEVLGA